MGLDMYLKEHAYIGHYEYMQTHGEESLKEYKKFEEVVDLTGFVNTPGDPNSSVSLELNIAYWRKAHAIHGWFVQNVQGGRDECQDAYVSFENLEQLLADCKQAIDDPELAKETLPATDGFFFGMNRDEPYDEWYWSDLRDTVKMLQPIVDRTRKAMQKSGKTYAPCEFYYQSSW